MKRVKQFRYYEVPSQTNQKNQPSNLNISQLTSGSIFEPYQPIVQLGIQSLPGTKFYLNGSNNPVILGTTGIYELDLYGLAEITSIFFDGNSIDAIAKTPSASLIVDIIYEDGEDA